MTDLIPFTIDELRNAKGLERQIMLNNWRDYMERSRKQDKKEIKRIKDKLWRKKVGVKRCKEIKRNWIDRIKSDPEKYERHVIKHRISARAYYKRNRVKILAQTKERRLRKKVNNG